MRGPPRKSSPFATTICDGPAASDRINRLQAFSPAPLQSDCGGTGRQRNDPRNRPPTTVYLGHFAPLHVGEHHSHFLRALSSDLFIPLCMQMMQKISLSDSLGSPSFGTLS